MIKKLVIENFKCFNGRFELEFNNEINILVGNNGVGKTTILEAVHMVLSGTYNGRNIKNSLNEYFFNKTVVDNYLKKYKETAQKPKILIELYVDNERFPELQGDDFSDKNNLDKDISGISLKIEFNEEEYNEEFNELINDESEILTSLPTEWYKIEWTTFARKKILNFKTPIKSSFIDITGSNNYLDESNLARIIRNTLEEKDKMNISQSFRKLKQKFSKDITDLKINNKLSLPNILQDQKIELNIDLGIRSIWENSLITHLDKIPYDMIGKGEQAIMKIAIALSNQNANDSQIILIEEPESHISHTRLNKLLNTIQETHKNKQLIISTHSSFVSNKLGLNNLILLNNDNQVIKSINFKDLDRINYFKKLSGYDTLRMCLSNKVVLVEGPSDELIFQKVYMNANNGKLPIEDQIEVISVGTASLNFLEISKKLNKKTIVIVDNDGIPEKIKEKYQDYKNNINISIFFEDNINNYKDLNLEQESNLNLNTLESYILKANTLKNLNNVLQKNYDNNTDLLKYMLSNKTTVALKIFESQEDIIFPNYIKTGVEKINE